MKNKISILFLAILSILGCSDDFLEKRPKDQLVIENTFISYSNFKTYAWGFYSTFPGYSLIPVNSEFNGDLILQSNEGAMSNWIRKLIIVPTTSGDYSEPYNRIRRINLMLDNIDQASMNATEKKHWRSVGYFFRAYEYFDLVSKYGDIIWVEHALNENSQELYSPRTPRNEVTQKILDNLLYAEENIKMNGDGPNTIGINAVRALISRFGLFEGTWRKYHNLDNASKYLQASVNASEKLMTAYPAIHSNYDEVFNSESLANIPGIILYKEYVMGQQTHLLTSRLRTSSGNWDLTKKAADMYLLKDGNTRWTSSLFTDDKDPYEEFKDRDKRMYYTIEPPYKVISPIPGSSNVFQWNYTNNTKEREYIDLMDELSDNNHKTLPSINWEGIVMKQSPHFRRFNNGQGFNAGLTGYRLIKYSNKYLRIQSQDISDAPVFRIEEIMLNYAEAQYELGAFSQTIADATINKLRTRAGVKPLIVGSEPNDPTRDNSVPPSLWEIRRERAIELMAEGFRFNDLRRWKKMNYTDEEKLGRWIKRSDYGNQVPTQNNASEGYVRVHGQPPGTFPNHYYLYPIPSNEILLNPNIKQNLGWE